MKYDCGKEQDEIDSELSDWHRVFALFPKKVAPHDCRWLEFIERKGVKVGHWEGVYWKWEYRAIK